MRLSDDGCLSYAEPNMRSLNILRLWQKSRHFADDIFKCIIVDEKNEFR